METSIVYRSFCAEVFVIVVERGDKFVQPSEKVGRLQKNRFESVAFEN